MDGPLAFFKAAGDACRLRILRLLLLEDALNVGELTRILGIAQSNVSQKLRTLRKAGLIEERRQGGFTYYAMTRRPGDLSYEFLSSALSASSDEHGDLARLTEVQRERRDRGGAGGKMLEPGRSWVAWARALRFILPHLRVADFGCGDGALTVEIAAWAEHVTAVERDAAALTAARSRISAAGVTNIDLIAGDIASVDLAATSVDLVVISHCLHHAPTPSTILHRAHEVLAPRGRVLILELASHREEWVKEKLGHARLGFSVDELDKGLGEVGFGSVDVELTTKRAAPVPFRIIIASAVKP